MLKHSHVQYRYECISTQIHRKEFTMKRSLSTISMAFSLFYVAASSTAQTSESRSKQYRKLSPAQFRLRVRKEADKIHTCRNVYLNTFDLTSILTPSGEQPIRTLIDMGLEVLPVLVEYLHDSTPSAVVPSAFSRRKTITVEQPYRVNQLIAGVIERVREHYFYVLQPPEDTLHPIAFDSSTEITNRYKKTILDWYAKNRKASIEDRKIADLNDPMESVRWATIDWLGEHHAAKAWSPVSAYLLEFISRSGRNSLDEAYIAEGIRALGGIGDRRGIDAVAEGIKFLSKQFAERKDEDLRLGELVFRACEVRAQLGDSRGALSDLKLLYSQCEITMSKPAHSEFLNNLSSAEKWRASKKPIKK